MAAYKIIHEVIEAFSGLPQRLSDITGKTWQLYYSHGAEPKTKNPLSSGNLSPVDHYMLYCRQYEAAIRGAGQMLNHRVHAELDVLKCFSAAEFENLSIPELAKIEKECAEMRDAASDAVAHLRALQQVRRAER